MAKEKSEVDQDDRPKQTLLQKAMKYIWVVFPAIILAWLIYLFAFGSLIKTWETRGQFGDLFGGFTALVSGLAFAGIIIAILLQRQDLELQREELKLARLEFARAADAQEQQNETLLITAKLNSHAALVGYYSATSNPIAGEMERDPLRSSHHAGALEEMIERLEEQVDHDERGREGG